MKRKLLCCALAVLLILTGCGAVSDIAGNVADAAKTELENQVKAALEKYKVDVVEIKTTVGKLNGDTGDIQFFCAALVKSGSDTLPRSCADALGMLFDDSGVMVQTGSGVESQYLEHKDLNFDHRDFSGGNYYTIFVYKSVIGKDGGKG